MEIDAMRLNLPMASHSTVAPVVAPEDVVAFSQALFGQSHATPEQGALGQLQHTAGTVNLALADVKNITHDSPLKMLSAQSTLLHSIFEVDLIAKTAGGLTQGINKLVSMQ